MEMHNTKKYCSMIELNNNYFHKKILCFHILNFHNCRDVREKRAG